MALRGVGYHESLGMRGVLLGFSVASVLRLGLHDGVVGPLLFFFPVVSPPSLTCRECVGKWGVVALL